MANDAYAQIRVKADTADAVSNLKNLSTAVTDVNTAVGNLYGSKNGYSTVFADMTKDLQTMVKEFETAVKQMETLSKTQNQLLKTNGSTSSAQGYSIKNQANIFSKDYIETLKKNQKEIDKVTKSLNNRQFESVRMLAKEEKNYQKTLAQRQAIYNSTAKAFDTNLQKYQNAYTSQQKYANALSSREQYKSNGFLRRIANSSAYITGYAVYGALSSGLTSGLQAIRDYESGITDLRRTLEQGEMSLSQFEAQLSNFGKLAVEDAKDFGTSISDVQEAMTELARAGVGAGDLSGMTETVLMGLNTTEIGTASDVTSALVSTIKQMDMDWSDSTLILDSWNMLSDRYAVQTDDFAAAIERSGAASKMLGMDLYDLNAVVTILGESTQASGEEVGTAFRSLSARLLRDSTIEKLAEYGIQVKDSNDTFLDFEQIMKNINEVIKDLPDDSTVLSDIMDTLGGSWRKNWVTALTQDFGRFDDLVAEQAESVGYSAAENEKAMDTIAKKAETLKQTFLEMFIDIGNAGGEDAIKDMLDGMSNALESAINSPTIRKVSEFLFGNPLMSLGVGAAALSLGKATYGTSPLQALAAVVNSKVSTSNSTLGGWLNRWYNSTGVSGKQNRAEKLYDSIKKTYNLTDTEMVPIAGRIDGIFKSSTTSIAQAGSEVERLKANLADAQTYSKSLFTKEGKQKFTQGLQISTGSANSSNWAALQREQQRSLDAVVSAQREYERAQASYNKIQDASSTANERGVFNTIASSKFKEGVKSFAKGLASGAVQLVAIAAAAEGLDYIINYDSNNHNNFSDAMTSYQETLSSIQSAQELAASLDTGQLSLVSSKGENLGLSATDFNSITSQLDELKSSSDEVASAVEKSARQLGNYGNAAEAASEALAVLAQNQASAFLAENKDTYAKDMQSWKNDLSDARNDWVLRDNKINGVFSGLGIDTSMTGFVSDDKYLENIETITKNRQLIADALKESGLKQFDTTDEINEFFDGMNEQKNIIKSAIQSAQEYGKAEFAANLYDTADNVVEMLDGLENYNAVQTSLSDLIGQAQSVNQAENLEKFVGNLAGDKEMLSAYNEMRDNLSDMSEMAVSDVSDQLKEFAKEAEDNGLTDDADSLMDSLFRQYFDFDSSTYESKLKQTNSRIKELGVNLKKALDVDSLTDLNASNFSGLSDLINELQYQTEQGSKTADMMVDALNSGMFADADFSKLNINSLWSLSENQFSSVLSAMQDMQSGAEGLGATLQSAFGDDISEAFNNLVSVAQNGSEGFAEAMNNIFTQIGDMDVSDQAQTIMDMADLFNVALDSVDNESLKKIGFKVEVDEDGVEWLSTLHDDETTTKLLQIDTEVDDSSLEETKNELENTKAKMMVDVDTNEVENKVSEIKESAESTPVEIPVSVQTKGDDIRNAATAAGTSSVFNVEFKADTSEVESAKSEISSGMEIPVSVQIKGDELRDAASPGAFFEDVECTVDVNADTSDAKAAVNDLAGSENTTEVKVSADTSQAKTDIDALGNTSTVKVSVNADTSKAVSQIQAIKSAVPEIKINVSANTSVLSSSLNGVKATASGIQTSLLGAAASAASANTSIASLNTQIQSVIAAMNQLQAAFATPVTFNFQGMEELNNLAPTISNAGSAAQTAMLQIQTNIQATAAAFAAGCSQMVSAWSSMSFPAPYIPTPHITTSVGLGTYDVSIAWYAKGGIIPATPGGRIVGVGEGGEDEAIVPISKLQDYIKTAMSEVASDFGSFSSESMEKMWSDFARDLNTYTSNGYYATKVKMPYLELSQEAEDILHDFTRNSVNLGSYDFGEVDKVIEYLTYDSDVMDKMIDDAQDMVDFYEAYGDSINQARSELELFELQYKQLPEIQNEINQLVQQANYLQSKSDEDLSSFLDTNYELNALYDERVEAFEDGNDEAKEAFQEQIEGYQKVIQTIDELQDKLRELNTELTSKVNKLAQSYLESSINDTYDTQKKEIEDRLELIEDERDAYLDDLEEQRDRLDDAKDAFEKEIDAKDQELQDRIDAIKEKQDQRDNEKKLKDLQEKIKDAQDRLDGLTNDYNTKVYTMGENGEWQFTYEADPDELKEATEDLEEAQNDLQEFYEDQEIDRLEKEQDVLQKRLDTYNDEYDAMIDALEKEQEAREDAWDEETEALQEQLDKINDMLDAALENVPATAKKLIDQLMSVLGGDLSSVYDYLQIASGSYGTESYNPLGAVFKTDYAEKIYQSGVNLEQYTNELLDITRNAASYSATQVLNAKNELEKLGTTGSIDLTGRVEISSALASALGNSAGVGLNEFIYSVLSRIGSIRSADSGTGDAARGKGKVVTAEHVADYFNKLGLNVDVASIKAYADSQSVYDSMGTIGEFMQNIFSGLTINGDGSTSKKTLADILSGVGNVGDVVSDIESIANKIGVSVDVNADNLISQLGFTGTQLTDIKNGTADSSSLLLQQISELTGMIDANTYYSSKDVKKSEELIEAMGDSTDVNEFILDELRKIGTSKESGDTYTKDEIYKYLESLGISEELINNTVKSNLLLQEVTQKSVTSIQDNTEKLFDNTKSVKSLKDSVTKNITGQSDLTAAIQGAVIKSEKIVNEFSSKLKEYIGEIDATTDEVTEDVAAAASGTTATKQSLKAASTALNAAMKAQASLGGGSYADGGVISYTGNAQVHGSKSSPEVVFNASDAKKLYDFVHNGGTLLSSIDMSDIVSDLTQLYLPRIDKINSLDIKTQDAGSQRPMTIENITMEFPKVNDPDGVKQAILNLSRDIKLYV